MSYGTWYVQYEGKIVFLSFVLHCAQFGVCLRTLLSQFCRFFTPKKKKEFLSREASPVTRVIYNCSFPVIRSICVKVVNCLHRSPDRKWKTRRNYHTADWQRFRKILGAAKRHEQCFLLIKTTYSYRYSRSE